MGQADTRQLAAIAGKAHLLHCLMVIQMAAKSALESITLETETLRIADGTPEPEQAVQTAADLAKAAGSDVVGKVGQRGPDERARLLEQAQAFHQQAVGAMVDLCGHAREVGRLLKLRDPEAKEADKAAINRLEQNLEEKKAARGTLIDTTA